ncbi:MAG: hypothetical protein NTY33_00755 [Candidatus Moranbacteria bacterium]|nr:hypothetical protein [Candidatus Moranbacteria bacterium]
MTKRHVFFISLLVIVAGLALITGGCASPGKTEWSRSYKGPGANPGGGVMASSPAFSATPTKDDWTPTQGYPIKESKSDWAPTEGRQIAPTAVSNMPASRTTDFSAPPPAKTEETLPPCAGGRCGSWVQQGGKFVWAPNAR